ncbi:peptide chain release factor N(5)-glutamine methyltransferase [Kordiimonas aquimaris]|uniref:peptide chain release factor N(5)-glutamine methyltransferase n=1 Tax=Kordiimonas aquimaris TaxID=707591 RepID=UPI0021D23152|nr:peptide chain release factor N(5)-glutamine methyltransferase [Kordiimonas aquimaris]
MIEAVDLLPSKVLRGAVECLAGKGNPNAQRDAEVMLAHVLSVAPSHLPLINESMSIADYQVFQHMIERRLTNEPVAYITGRQSFWTGEFIVDEHTLIPRPDTETLVEVGALALKGINDGQVLDIGTGSGCVLLSILSEAESSTGVGIDVSEGALAIAAQNADENNLNARTRFILGDMFEPFNGEKLQKADLIVSNPPYIPTQDIDDLMDDVRDYEPLSALDGGADGYDFYRRIANESALYLKIGGILAVEVGFDQAQTVRALFEAVGFKDILINQDLNGIDRVVSGKNS